ncbi:MAG: cytochrome-c peroxidase [Anaerolinea sp.]|nr:cytochrome-c peroxidase [Anaerolinea sp.]
MARPIVIAALLLFLIGCTTNAPLSLDDQLQTVITQYGLTPLDPGPTPDPTAVALGQALFFDKLLSGNRDISCATCHHPTLASGDGLPVSIGAGGRGLGTERIVGYRRGFIPRNATELFNRGVPEWRTMFWDIRVAVTDDGQFISPADDMLPPGLDNILAVQAMFPVTSGAEMRGAYGDLDINHSPNELSLYNEYEFNEMWDTLMVRLLANPDYVALFTAAFPAIPTNELGFQHAANALAAFEIDAFTLLNSPWDRYLAGETAALSATQKRGALLFYGPAGCANCHAGNLLTDQQPHNIGVPQVGPGKGEEAPLDLGRARELQGQYGRFAFRTPPLRNVAVTAPYMHNGAFSTLATAVVHHLDPTNSLRHYDETQHLPPYLWGTWQNRETLLIDMLLTLDPAINRKRTLTDAELSDLLAFLDALTDPAVHQLDHLIPASVPSGLPVADTR